MYFGYIKLTMLSEMLPLQFTSLRLTSRQHCHPSPSGQTCSGHVTPKLNLCERIIPFSWKLSSKNFLLLTFATILGMTVQNECSHCHKGDAHCYNCALHGWQCFVPVNVLLTDSTNACSQLENSNRSKLTGRGWS